MTKIVIFGAGGQAGSAALAEASSRGHLVTARRRTAADVTDPRAVASAALGHDAAVAAVAPSTGDPAEFYRATADSLSTGLIAANVHRLVWVSIASLLPDASGVAAVDARDFPAEYRPFSLGHRVALERFTQSELLWTAISPTGDFDPTGAAALGYTLTTRSDLAARITYADFARALIDLAEKPGEHIASQVGARSPTRSG